MKARKQPKETKYSVRITEGAALKSEHIFTCEFQAQEFYEKIKFALEILQNDWYYVCLVKEEN